MPLNKETKQIKTLFLKKYKHTLHKQATPDDGLGRVQKFLKQFWEIHLPIPVETKTLIRKLERILNKLYWQNLSLLFNETCLNERLLPNYKYIYIYTYICIYIYTHL